MTHEMLGRLAAASAVALAVAFPSLAQQGPRFDPKTEVTVKGTVEEAKEVSGPAGGRAGMHVQLKAESGVFDVRLGPAEYWKNHGFELAKGDAIEVTGWKVKSGDSEILIARKVKKGDKTVTLRDASGVPAWSGGQRSQ